MEFLPRQQLANRWKVSVRTVDRLKNNGRLPWVDLSGGVGSRPIVRFRLCDVEAYEDRVHQSVQRAMPKSEETL